jgi:hypothetical protein
MLRFIRRRLYRNGWEKVTYKDLIEQPLGRMVTAFIGLAVGEGATKITFGMPQGMELSKEDEAEIRADHDNNIARYVSNVNKEVSDKTDVKQPLGGTRDTFARFHRRDNLPEVPQWHEIEGRWFRYHGILAQIYPYLPQHLCERLVSLDGKQEWIEYTSFPGEENRKFVRVDLVIEVNNSFTIGLLENRIVQNDASVWWRHWRV